MDITLEGGLISTKYTVILVKMGLSVGSNLNTLDFRTDVNGFQKSYMICVTVTY